MNESIGKIALQDRSNELLDHLIELETMFDLAQGEPQLTGGYDPQGHQRVRSAINALSGDPVFMDA